MRRKLCILLVSGRIIRLSSIIMQRSFLGEDRKNNLSPPAGFNKHALNFSIG